MSDPIDDDNYKRMEQLERELAEAKTRIAGLDLCMACIDDIVNGFNRAEITPENALVAQVGRTKLELVRAIAERDALRSAMSEGKVDLLDKLIDAQAELAEAIKERDGTLQDFVRCADCGRDVPRMDATEQTTFEGTTMHCDQRCPKARSTCWTG